MSEFKMPELPDLPESDGHIEYPAEPYAPAWVSSAEAFSEEKVREYAEAYGRLCAQQMREACAKECDGETEIAHGEFGAGWVEGAKVCAAAIRSIQVGGEK